MEKEMTHIEQHGDEVTNGIRKWEQVKKASEEAIARCRKAEEEVTFIRGEQAAMKQRCEGLEARNHKLMEENAEYKMLLSDLGQRFLEVLQNSKLSPFRAPGSIKAAAVTGSATTPKSVNIVNVESLEAGINDLAKQVATQRVNLSTAKV